MKTKAQSELEKKVISELPKSKLVKSQFKVIEGMMSPREKIKITLRYDDECGNGHNSFAMTADIKEQNDFGRWVDTTGGCCHDEIIKARPDLAKFVKWHLCDSTGPMHHIANSLYHAGNRDCHGLLKGEKRQIKNGRTGVPCWCHVAVDKETGEELPLYKLDNSMEAASAPACKYTLEVRPWCSVGEGKEPDLKAARSCAIWPDAKLEDFTEEKLLMRLPGLMREFKTAMEELGFTY